MRRNAEIDWWRFVICLLIVDYHFLTYRLFQWGAIGVEFFFMLSGYLLAAGISKKDSTGDVTWLTINQETFSLLKRRIWALFPETFMACAIAYLLYVLGPHREHDEYFLQFVSTMLGDACFLGMTGLFPVGLNLPTWYLSTLLMCSLILYPLIRRWGISPFLGVVGILIIGTLLVNRDMDTFFSAKTLIGTYTGNYRGFADMCIGVSLYPIVNWLRVRYRPTFDTKKPFLR